MVEFKEVAFGEREMTASLKSVHLDKPEEVCAVTGRNPKSQQVHFQLEPSQPEGWKTQNWWLYDTLASGSSWHEAVKQFRKIGIISESDIQSATSNFELAKKILEKAKGKNIKFVERRLGRALRPNWFPESVA